MRGAEAGPPRLAERLLASVLPDDVAGRSILGDLRQEFVARAARDARSARWWYRREATAVAAHGLARRRGEPPGMNTNREGDPVWKDLTNDAKHAVRGIARSPRFAAVAALTLALGIGAATAIFSVVKGVLLEPLAYPDPDRLVNVGSTAPGLGYDRFGISPDLYYFYQTESRAFESQGMYQIRRATLTGDDQPVRVPAAVVTHTLLPTLGVEVALGRGIRAEDDRPDAPLVALLSHGLWQRRYGGDPGVIDRTILVDGQPVVVAGVLPEGFDFLRESFIAGGDGTDAAGADLWMPAQLDADNPPISSFSWNAVARLAPGVTPEAAQAQIAPLVPRLLEESQATPNYRAFVTTGQYAPVVASMKEDLVGDIEGPLWILLGTVLVVLLIACANVANLMLIRAEGLQRDTAVQAALGASRGLLVRKKIVEALVLAAIGGAAGLLVAAAGTPALVRLAPPEIPRLANVSVDAGVALFALAAAFASAAFFGVMPAIRYTRPAILATLRHGGRGATVGRARNRVRGLLVVTQTALALVLLVGSGLLVRSLQRVLATDPGFETADRITFRLSLPATKYATPQDMTQFYTLLLDRLAAQPGVETAAAVSVLPLVGGAPGTAWLAEGRPIGPDELPPMLHAKLASPEYMESMAIDVEAGRALTRADIGTENVVVNRVVADRLWPGEDPIGRRLRTAGDTIGWFNVVGVVEPVLQLGFREPPQALVYAPLGAPRFPVAPQNMTFVLKGPAAARGAAGLQQAVWDLDPELPLASVRTMGAIASASVVTLSFTVLTLGIAAGLALVLGAIGLYGVLAYAVSMRTREIGVRLALGAQRNTVMGMVIAQGARLAAIGLGIGVLGAAAATRLLEGVLFGVEPLDATTFALMSVVFLVVALVASWLPARRAASVDPMTSLQNE